MIGLETGEQPWARHQGTRYDGGSGEYGVGGGRDLGLRDRGDACANDRSLCMITTPTAGAGLGERPADLHRTQKELAIGRLCGEKHDRGDTAAAGDVSVGLEVSPPRR